MFWQPTVDKEKLNDPLFGDSIVLKDKLLRSVGLYKVQGDAVMGIIGAIYEQFVRILPILLILLFPDSTSSV